MDVIQIPTYASHLALISECPGIKPNPKIFGSGGGYSICMWRIGPTITKSKSKFVGRIAKISSLEDADKLLKELKRNPSTKDATHHISAARVNLGTNSALEVSNDNGEPPAGSRLLQVIKSNNISNVLLVVSRWYGGKKLGSERFRVIDDVAKDIIDQWKESHPK